MMQVLRCFETREQLKMGEGRRGEGTRQEGGRGKRARKLRLVETFKIFPKV